MSQMTIFPGRNMYMDLAKIFAIHFSFHCTIKREINENSFVKIQYYMHSKC